MNASEALNFGRERLVVPLPDRMVRHLDWRALYALTTPPTRIFTALLDELSIEHCGHSWRAHLDDLRELSGAARTVELLARTQKFRETAVFVYQAECLDGTHRTVALATISDRIRKDFPHDGFPVLARCYIRSAWREKGLYSALVRHRISLCRERWGSDLHAIHIGASHPSVRTALNGELGQASPFVHVGDEVLSVSGRRYLVEDMVSFTDEYRSRLMGALPRENDPQRAFLAMLGLFLEQGTAVVSHDELRTSWAHLGVPMPPSLRQLFDLLSAIGAES